MEAQHAPTNFEPCSGVTAELYEQLDRQTAELPADRRRALEDMMASDLVGDLKRAVKRSRKTHYELARSAGISPAQLDRFMAGTRDLRLQTAAAIANVLGVQLADKSQLVTLEDLEARLERRHGGKASRTAAT